MVQTQNERCRYRVSRPNYQKKTNVGFNQVDSSYAKDHLLYVVGQRDRIISRLRAEIAEQKKEISGLKHRLRTNVFVGGRPKTPAIGMGMGGHGPPSSAREQKGKGNIGEFRDGVFFEQFERLRKDYAIRLSKKLAIVKSFQGLPKNIFTIIEQMERQLVHETCQRQLERAMFDTRLYEMEHSESCWFIDQKILKSQISDLKKELANRDSIDARIEAQVYQILQRSEKLEKENKALKASRKKRNSEEITLESLI
jgi:hypothetical protein